MTYGSRPDDLPAISYRLGNSQVFFSFDEDLGRSNGGTGLMESHREGIDQSEAPKPEIAHRAGGCANVQWIARPHQYYAQPIGLSGRNQGPQILR